MAEGYTKLFSGIVMSTVWTYDSDTKVVWITMLAMADERGQVIGTVPGLAKMAGVSIEATRKAIYTFLSPDPDSGSREFEGRRIEAIDRGWRLLMHAKYRALRSKEEKLEADRLRVAAKRAAEKIQTISSVSQESQNVAEVAHAEAEASAEADKENPPPACAPAIHGGSAPVLWSANDWLVKFRTAFQDANKGIFYGRGAGDGKALGTLQDSLDALPAEGRIAAQLRAPLIFAEFMGDRSPKAVAEKYQFSYFVLLFNGLRTPAKEAAARAGPGPRPPSTATRDAFASLLSEGKP